MDRKYNILIIDDLKDNRFLMTAYLKTLNVSISQAENGLQGLEKFKTGNFNLILLDIQMPGIDGYETIKQMREYELEKNISRTRVIAVTAYGGETDFEHMRDSGFDNYIAKPLDKKRFLKAIEFSLHFDLS